MAVMARLLAAGNLSQNIAEEVSQLKLAARYICRELREADEPNLLDEEDMHVFGLMPMTDPLDLVCCNACKKPVKVSQYAAHAELCRFLIPAEEITLEPDGGTGRRKPPRKERRKLLTAYSNQITPVGGRQRSESIVPDDTVASESQLDGQPRMPSSFSLGPKRNSASIDVASMMDGKGVSPENTDYSACVMPPPTKRHKSISSEHRPRSDDPETASGLTKATSTVDPFTYVPVPLATKVYYSQRNTRLRSAVAYLYHAAAAEGLNNNMVNSEISQESIMQLQASSQRGSLDAQTDVLINDKRDPSVQQHDQALAQSSEMCLDKSEGSPPLTNFSNQYPLDNIIRPQAASMGMLQSKYLSKPYSFAGNSGQSLGTMQQPNGTVPIFCGEGLIYCELVFKLTCFLTVSLYRTPKKSEGSSELRKHVVFVVAIGSLVRVGNCCLNSKRNQVGVPSQQDLVSCLPSYAYYGDEVANGNGLNCDSNRFGQPLGFVLGFVRCLKPCIIVKSVLVHYKISAPCDDVAGLPQGRNWMDLLSFVEGFYHLM
ncbi:unnamed protein product [Dovyalis caffra]|uniref:SAGA-associated factor 11 n=1 Tax=Dovyalis caffra TaxID=77055 RepID=A0AAV1REL0_9ROSI|nr:unnamed protein product [Dovyalis caffra]